MIKEYLTQLKTKGGFSWHSISEASGLPEATIRKIFSGETADPRFETVVKLVTAMGGSLDKVNAIEKIKNVETSEESHIKALDAIKEVYELRIKDLKESSAEYLKSVKRDKRILIYVALVLSIFLIGALLLDIFVSSTGWVRY